MRTTITGGAMLYDPSRVGNATGDLLRARYWQARGTASQPPAGRGEAYFIEDEGRSWVLRHYRRGGWIARVSSDSYLWTGETRTRPFREWQLLHELHLAGLPVPAPVAAGYRRQGPLGLTYTGDLITERIAGTQPLSAVLTSRALAAVQWQAIGQCIRRFHDAGIFHADLNAHNILIREDGAVFIIDFDRGSRREPGEWTNKNLRRLRRSLDKVSARWPHERFTEANWSALMSGYAANISQGRT